MAAAKNSPGFQFGKSFFEQVRKLDVPLQRLLQPDKLYTCEEIHERERASINKRRGAGNHVKEFSGFGPATAANKEDAVPVLDTVGLALSGGGVRSAAFCLGAIQALDVADVLKRVDYLSTVSGGGYIGCAMSSGMSLNDGHIPFPSEIRKDERPALQHIRDYSNYLVPHGVADYLRSIVIYFRGLVASLMHIAPWMIFAAAITVYINPKRADLLQPTLLLAIWNQFPWLDQPPAFFKDAVFLLPSLLAVAFVLAIAGWAIYRSRRTKADKPEVPGLAPNLFVWFLVAVVAVFFFTLQPVILDTMFAAADAAAKAAAKAAAEAAAKDGKAATSVAASLSVFDWIQYIIVLLTPIAAAVGLVGNKLLWFIRQSNEASSWTAKLKSLASRAAVLLAALIIPLLLWIVYLRICFWAIADNELNKFRYAAPGWLESMASWFFDQTSVVFYGFFLQAVEGAPGFMPFMLAYIALWLLALAASLLLNENANSLHRLYRDRLSKAFLVRPTDKIVRRDEEIKTIDRFKLTDIDETKSPYHLINAALNIQASKAANRRGRNADFFLFSKEFIGSDSTGYVTNKLMATRGRRAIDLATAMAISGAAASSNMGTSSIRAWTASLALLNVRLGYWLLNPKRLVDPLIKRLEFRIPYFALEMFGLLNEERKYIYVTDGGHVENLGIYELLRRRCCLIVAVDAEADPGMNFNSLVRLERYARIDLGIRIKLPWQEIRAATLLASSEVEKRGDPGNLVTKAGPHCAIGKIYYPGGEGRLLYIKSSLTGDESSYVTDYKRRNPAFPHETTGDQFFSEEQFEAYRALGFHATRGVFSQEDRIAIVNEVGAKPDAKTSRGEKAAIARERKAMAEINSVLNAKRTKTLPRFAPHARLPEDVTIYERAKA
ncbi:MAG: patatin-like phospholipase family protein [Pseudolabrys sp.]